MTSDNKLLIVDPSGCSVLICDRDTGALVAQILGVTNGNGDVIDFKQPHGVVVDGTDKIMVTDKALNSVLMI